MREITLGKITIISGTRVTTIRHPETGSLTTHGLGPIGEVITPFLDHRTEGYVLVIGEGAESPRVYEVNTRAERLASGKFPALQVPWSALGADDVDPFAAYHAGGAE